MTDKKIFYLTHGQARANAVIAVNQAPDGCKVEITPPARSKDANAAQWPLLRALSRQKKWAVNGEMTYMTPDEWKDVLTPAFEAETFRLAAGYSGGVVMLGRRTSKFGKKKFSEWIEFLKCVCANFDVNTNEIE